jgi:S1-C subfamily serine protease
MSGYNYQPPPKRRRSGWLIGCGAGVVVTICVVVFFAVGGLAGIVALFGGSPEGLAVDVQTPSTQVSVGQKFTISVTLKNVGTQNIEVTEIQLPNNLIEAAIITNIDPQGVKDLDYGEKTGFDFNLVIAPNGQQTVVFSFEALKAGDYSGDIGVQVGTKTADTAIRVVIAPQGTGGQTGGDDPVLGEVIPYQSVVQIIAIVDLDGERVQGWTGSGTIISDDGLILTNAHVVLSDRYYEVVDLVVSITLEQDRPPEPMFYADVLQADANLDLAVIKVRSDLNGGVPDFAGLGIPSVPLGNSDELQLGDPLIIIGYPGIGGETITLTRGEVSGFTAESPYGNRAFIKTSATIAGGNSGGLAATPQGEIIGVPTQVGSGDLEDLVVDCRPLADTNRDGVVDDRDNCVPTGGFINALRPIKLAMPMIQAAQAGQVAIEEESQAPSGGEYDPEGDVILSEDFNDNDNNWNLGSSNQGGVDISNGQLLIEVNKDNYIIWSDLPDTYESLIMVMEVNVVQPAGDADFGFICGLEDVENFTALEISEDGYYTIWKYANGEFESLVEWTFSDTVAAGGPFTLAAYCGPDRLALAVNDTLLAETTDPNYVAGRVGVAAGAYENPDVIIGFDNFIIMRP